VRLYLDEDLPPRLAEMLRRRGIDAVSAHELGNIRLTDREQLDRAVRQGRCLVSANARDFIVIGKAAVAAGTPHAGIVLCPPRAHRGDVAGLARRLTELAGRYPRGLGEYDVIYL
jgi:predicted nuclease of predicted toxin-antitoxin system